MATATNSTKLIKISDSSYPVYLYQVRRDNNNISLPAEPTEAQLVDLGYEIVFPTTPPVADVVTEGVPVNTGGVWQQAWVSRAFNTEELATQLTQKKAELSAQLIGPYTTGILEKGIEYDFGTGFGVLHIQVRDGDRANLAGLRINSDAAVAAGLDDAAHSMYFRTQENINVPLKPSEIIAMTNAALLGYYTALQPIWAMKDQITAATDLAGLPVIPAL